MDAPRPRPRSYLARLFIGRPRLFISIAGALAIFALEPSAWRTATRLLIAWNIASGVYIAWSLAAMAGATTKTVRSRARITDEGRFVILILVSLAALAATAAIFAQLGMTKDLKGTEKALHTGLAALTILTSWIFIHLTFALHYAHEFFDEEVLEGEKPRRKGGVNFPGTDEPDYWDFLYFSFIIGVAAQTADVSITSKAIRRTSLAHSILAFFFNSAILALTINIASGLI